jgi:hypothetical protein
MRAKKRPHQLSMADAFFIRGKPPGTATLYNFCDTAGFVKKPKSKDADAAAGLPSSCLQLSPPRRKQSPVVQKHAPQRRPSPYRQRMVRHCRRQPPRFVPSAAKQLDLRCFIAEERLRRHIA